MTQFNDTSLEVPTDKVLDLAAQLSNDGSQPSQQDENQSEQRIPYERFKEVNDERKAFQEQNVKLMEMMQQFQNMQAQTQTVNTPDPQVNTQPAFQPLFTDAELDGFEQNIVLDPKATIQQLSQAILERGVEQRVKQVEQTFEQKLQAIAQQTAAQTLPTVIANFKQSRFSPNQTAEIAAFDQALQSMDPSLLSNPATLENVRLAAIGYVADQRQQTPQQNTQAFFSETPGGWGGLGGQQAAPQIPPQVIEAARKMGVDPKEAANFYSAMSTSGVFR